MLIIIIIIILTFLKKAFDTVNHSILSRKLSRFGHRTSSTLSFSTETKLLAVVEPSLTQTQYLSELPKVQSWARYCL